MPSFDQTKGNVLLKTIINSNYLILLIEVFFTSFLMQTNFGSFKM